MYPWIPPELRGLLPEYPGPCFLAGRRCTCDESVSRLEICCILLTILGDFAGTSTVGRWVGALTWDWPFFTLGLALSFCFWGVAVVWWKFLAVVVRCTCRLGELRSMAVLLPALGLGGPFWAFFLWGVAVVWWRFLAVVVRCICHLEGFPCMAVVWSASTLGLLFYSGRPCSSTWVCLNGMLFWLDWF